MWRRSRSVWLLLVCISGAAACRITPEEIQRIETENQLLREQIRTIREKCEYYDRELELEVDPGRSKER